MSCAAESIERPIAKLHPVTTLITPQKRTTEGVSLPEIDPTASMESDDAFEDWAIEIYEWLSLVGIESPRVLAEDSIDLYLSRYQIPFSHSDSPRNFSMVCLTWKGLLPADWVRGLFTQIM